MKSLSNFRRWLLCPGALLLGIFLAASAASAAEFVSGNGQFRVDMGAEPVEVILSRGQGLLQFQCSVRTTNGTYMVAHSDFPQSFDSSDRFEKHLSGVKAKFKQLLQVDDLQERSITHDGRVGREFQFISKAMGGNVRYRIFLVGKREYSVVASGGSDFVSSPRTSAFLDSFAVLSEPQDGTTHLLPFVDQSANFAALTLASVVSVPKERMGEAGKEMTAFLAQGNGGIYGIMYERVPGLNPNDARRIAEVAKNALNAMTEGNANKLTQTATRKVNESGIEATEFEFQGKAGSGMVRQRVFVDNERVYSLIVAGESELFEAKRPNVYLGAFTLLNSQSAGKVASATSSSETETPAPEPTPIEKPSNAQKTTREEAIRQLKDF